MAADIYEEFFLPALFEQWTGPVADAAGIKPGDQVLDVACGTGVLARALAGRVAPAGSVVGLDLNAGMLEVAQRRAPGLRWEKGRAEELPFDSDGFDAVVSQFGLMFFEDRVAALQEMLRVLRPGGRLAVAVWDALARTPGYAAMANLLDSLFGAEVAQSLRAPYVLGDTETLADLCRQAGIIGVRIETQPGMARFPSLQSWIFTDIRGWTLADVLDDEQVDLLRSRANTVLAEFVSADGAVTFSAPAHIVTARKT
jgi:SAM-dependent methyltransferase